MMEKRRIRLIAFDVDGTLTDGTICIGAEGELYKAFFARDGLAMSLARRMGYLVGVITGRRSAAVERRQEELHLDFACMGISDKVEAMEGLLSRFHLTWEEAAYMGDDLNDLALMARVGFSGCPADGAAENQKAAHFVTAAPGGRGAAREWIEAILKRDGCWEAAVQSLYTGSQKTAQ